jgi:hypothetical protein
MKRIRQSPMAVQGSAATNRLGIKDQQPADTALGPTESSVGLESQ